MTAHTLSYSVRENSYPKCMKSVVNPPTASSHIAGINPQSTRHFAWQPSAQGLTNITVLLPQSCDCSCYVSRLILTPPPL